MYNEKNYKSQIFWLKAKRFVIITISILLGVGLGIFLSFYSVDLLMLEDNMRIPTVAIPTVFFFLFSLLFTANIGKDIQESYCNIEIMNKLNDIYDKLNNMEKYDKEDTLLLKNVCNSITGKKLKRVTKSSNNNSNLNDTETNASVSDKTISSNITTPFTTDETKHSISTSDSIASTSNDDTLLDMNFSKKDSLDTTVKKEKIKKKKIPLIPAMANLETEDVYEYEEEDDDDEDNKNN